LNTGREREREREREFIPPVQRTLTDTQSYGREGTADPRPHKQSRTCGNNHEQRIQHLHTHTHTHTLAHLTHTHTQLNSHSAGLSEDVGVNVHHEVASRCVLHDEAHVLRRLEAGEQVDQEGVARAGDRLKDPLLAHQAADGQRGEESAVAGRRTSRPEVSERERGLPFHFVPRQDVALLQGFDGVQAAGPFVLRQQHLERVTCFFIIPKKHHVSCI